MAQFTTLYSGSSGNSAVVAEDGRYLLVDMGKSCRLTTLALKQLELAPEKLGGILVTHEHSDHVSGLKVFLKKCNVPVYASAATLDWLTARDLVPSSAQLNAIEGAGYDIAGFGVTAFPTSHDAIDCHGYRIITPRGHTMAIATDLGCLTDVVHTNLSAAQLVALESNYDPFMLRTGPYPYHLKTRIASPRGHLANGECAGKILELLQEGCEQFSLCHLSSENNTPQCALETVYHTLRAAGVAPGQDAVIRAARRHEASGWMEF